MSCGLPVTTDISSTNCVLLGSHPVRKLHLLPVLEGFPHTAVSPGINLPPASRRHLVENNSCAEEGGVALCLTVLPAFMVLALMNQPVVSVLPAYRLCRLYPAGLVSDFATCAQSFDILIYTIHAHVTEKENPHNVLSKFAVLFLAILMWPHGQ